MFIRVQADSWLYLVHSHLDVRALHTLCNLSRYNLKVSLLKSFMLCQTFQRLMNRAVKLMAASRVNCRAMKNQMVTLFVFYNKSTQ
jgi:hypothetical protein